jgi:hypothetical protein
MLSGCLLLSVINLFPELFSVQKDLPGSGLLYCLTSIKCNFYGIPLLSPNYFMINFTLNMMTDKRRLNEIFHLRVKAWECFGQITNERYPHGLYDTLDEEALHWVIFSSNKIVASARLNILINPNELPCPKTFQRVIAFNHQAFYFYSRLVVHPNYQGNNFSRLLDEARISFIKHQSDIRTTIATAGLRRAKKLEQYGFKILDKVKENDDYISMDSFETYIIQMQNE